ncbi:hypothetical protein D9619_000393 [Psilocybe cf. subviscida]|uniref:F-box domain-containing protein n=1 Tax=Psilocybe cf. subviscida TaxID=2480587 RepID=A0A8H5BDN9_9AGAR|nr:hypothetical protein D9619_000393 [Psilocybe cf. subviscida]
MFRAHSASPVCGLKRLLSLKSQKQQSPASQRPPTCGTPLERLPAHVLYDIGHSIDTRDVLHLSLCSHQLRIALIPLLYATVELKTNKHCKTSLLALSKNHDVTQYIRRLIVRPNSLQWTEPGDEVDEDGVASLVAAMASAGHLRALEAFEWDGIEMPHDAMWLALRKSCRSLRRISTTIGEGSLSASSPLWDFSDLRQVALNVKCHSLDWLAEGLPKTEKLPRKFWAMLLERCPRLEDLTIGGSAPSPRIFDVRHVTAGRWPRLRSISLGGMVLISTSSADHQQQKKDDAAFQDFFTLHTSLRNITLQHAEGSAHVPSVFSFPSPSSSSHPQSSQWPPRSQSLPQPLPRLESFSGPLRLARSLPTHTRMRTLRRLTLTALHHSASAFPPTCAVLQEEFGALRELGVWVDLSFGQQVSSASGGGGLGMGIGRRSAERERAEKGGRFDDMLMLRALLAGCPRLTHLDLACFTRPTFSFREFSRTLQTSAPYLESFTLVKMHKSSEDSEFAGPSGVSPKAAVRLAAENPRLRSFRICTTLDAWLNPREGRVKVLGVYEVVNSSAGAALSASGASLQDVSSSRESIMSGPQSAPASVTHFPPSSGSQPMASTAAMLHAHEYGQRNLTGRMYSRHLVVPVAPKERPLSHGGRDGATAPPSSFPQNLTQSMYASLSRVGSITSTVASHAHSHSRPQSYYANSYTGHSESSHDHSQAHGHHLHHHQSLQFQIPLPQPHQQQQQTAAAAATTTPAASHSRWGSRLRGHRRGASSGDATGSASASVSPSAWGSAPTAGSGSGSRSRRSSISNVVGSIAYALVGMKHGHGDKEKEKDRRGSVVSSHGSTTTASTGAASSVSRSASGSGSGSSGGGSPVVAGHEPGYPPNKSASASASTEDGFVLV